MKILRMITLLTLLAFAMAYTPKSIIEVKAESSDIPKNIQTVKIDGFNVKEDWVVKYSKFRSKTWNPLTQEMMQNPYEPRIRYGDDRAREESLEWWDIFPKSAADQELNAEDILPPGLPQDVKNADAEKQCLGIRAKFDFPGYNWIIVEPSYSRIAPQTPATTEEENNIPLLKEDRTPNVDGTDATAINAKVNYNTARIYEAPYFIWMVGKTQYIDVWVWGSGYKYNLEAHFEDYKGNTHVLNAASLDFLGWRNIRVEIPAYIPQSQIYSPRVQPLKFLRFKITSDPAEKMDGFFVYFDYMQALTDLYEEPFFGNTLQDTNKIWSQSQN